MGFYLNEAGGREAARLFLMQGTREDFMEWDQLMADVGVPKEKYSKMRADRIANLIFNACPVHLSLSEWTDIITKSIAELTANDPDDAFAEEAAGIEIGNKEPPSE